MKIYLLWREGPASEAATRKTVKITANKKRFFIFEIWIFFFPAVKINRNADISSWILLRCFLRAKTKGWIRARGSEIPPSRITSWERMRKYWKKNNKLWLVSQIHRLLFFFIIVFILRIFGLDYFIDDDLHILSFFFI